MLAVLEPLPELDRLRGELGVAELLVVGLERADVGRLLGEPLERGALRRRAGPSRRSRAAGTCAGQGTARSERRGPDLPEVAVEPLARGRRSPALQLLAACSSSGIWRPNGGAVDASASGGRSSVRTSSISSPSVARGARRTSIARSRRPPRESACCRRACARYGGWQRRSRPRRRAARGRRLPASSSTITSPLGSVTNSMRRRPSSDPRASDDDHRVGHGAREVPGPAPERRIGGDVPRADRAARATHRLRCRSCCGSGRLDTWTVPWKARPRAAADLVQRLLVVAAEEPHVRAPRPASPRGRRRDRSAWTVYSRPRARPAPRARAPSRNAAGRRRRTSFRRRCGSDRSRLAARAVGDREHLDPPRLDRPERLALAAPPARGTAASAPARRRRERVERRVGAVLDEQLPSGSVTNRTASPSTSGASTVTVTSQSRGRCSR